MKRSRLMPNKSSGGFLPTDIADLQLWLRADTITGLSDGDPIAAWGDESGNGNDATQGTEAKQPLYKITIFNSLPIVRFDGDDDILVAAGPAPSFTGEDKPSSVFSAISPTSLPARAVVVSFTSDTDADTQQTLDFIGSRYRFVKKDDGGTAKVTGDTEDPATGDKLLSYVETGLVASIFLNAAILGAADQDVDVGSLDIDTLGIGSANVGGTAESFYVGDIGEIIVYSRAITDTERANLDAYLSDKWGVLI